MVLKVRATDPDGPDTSVHYRIANGADNFHIDEKLVITLRLIQILSQVLPVYIYNFVIIVQV